MDIYQSWNWTFFVLLTSLVLFVLTSLVMVSESKEKPLSNSMRGLILLLGGPIIWAIGLYVIYFDTKGKEKRKLLKNLKNKLKKAKRLRRKLWLKKQCSDIVFAFKDNRFLDGLRNYLIIKLAGNKGIILNVHIEMVNHKGPWPLAIKQPSNVMMYRTAIVADSLSKDSFLAIGQDHIINDQFLNAYRNKIGYTYKFRGNKKL